MKLVILTALLLLAGPALAQTKSFYDSNGSFSGSSATHNNTTSFSDKSGRFNGSAIRNSDGTTSFYDRNGHFTGSVTNTTPQQQQQRQR